MISPSAPTGHIGAHRDSTGSVTSATEQQTLAASVVVGLSSGLGNQMFQYAMGRAVAARTGAPLFLDACAYRPGTQRAYELDHFQLPQRLVSWDLARLFNPFLARTWLERFTQALARRGNPRALVRERLFQYDEALVQSLVPPLYLHGYWQTERYFSSVACPLRSDFELRGPLSVSAGRVLDAIRAAGTSIAVHYRRADYDKNPRSKRLHRICDPAYYRRIEQIFMSRLSNLHWFIFSDDIQWVRANCSLQGPKYFVKPDPARAASEDMWLMSQCSHQAIANSTFSWWGAWLNRRRNKLVVAPKDWFGNSTKCTDDVVPPSWLKA